MKAIILAAILVAAVSLSLPGRAADTCKDCRDFQRACVKAHSQDACKTDYEICMKHCRQK